MFRHFLEHIKEIHTFIYFCEGPCQFVKKFFIILLFYCLSKRIDLQGHAIGVAFTIAVILELEWI